MNCRDFISEFEERGSLTESAQIHLNGCPDCRQTSGTQTHIWQAIDGFAKIEAPKNFEFSVKAKIASTKPADFQPQFLPILRYVLPLSAIVLVLGLLAFNTTFFFGGNNDLQVAQAVPPAPIVTEAPLNSFAPAEQTAENNKILPSYPNNASVINASNQTAKTISNRAETQFGALKTARKTETEPRKLTERNGSEIGGGSIDTAVTQPKVLTQQSFDPNEVNGGSINKGNAATAGSESIWALIGIEVVSLNGYRIVKTVRQNSLAERSGIKANDVIQAIDGVKLSASPMVESGKIEVRSLTITRGGEPKQITLKN